MAEMAALTLAREDLELKDVQFREIHSLNEEINEIWYRLIQSWFTAKTAVLIFNKNPPDFYIFKKKKKIIPK